MENSRRRKEHSESAIIETGEKVTKYGAVFTAITFFLTYIYCLFLDIRDKRRINKRFK